MYDFDPELPRGFQDADFEMRALVQSANRASAARKRGICDHSWTGGDPANPSGRICYHCNATFASEAAEDASRDEAREKMI